MEGLLQSVPDWIGTAEAIIALASALVGALAGWFGKRRQGNSQAKRQP